MFNIVFIAHIHCSDQKQVLQENTSSIPDLDNFFYMECDQSVPTCMCMAITVLGATMSLLGFQYCIHDLSYCVCSPGRSPEYIDITETWSRFLLSPHFASSILSLEGHHELLCCADILWPK